MIKRILSILLAAIMFLSLLPVNAIADETDTQPEDKTTQETVVEESSETKDEEPVASVPAESTPSVGGTAELDNNNDPAGDTTQSTVSTPAESAEDAYTPVEGASEGAAQGTENSAEASSDPQEDASEPAEPQGDDLALADGGNADPAPEASDDESEQTGDATENGTDTDSADDGQTVDPASEPTDLDTDEPEPSNEPVVVRFVLFPVDLTLNVYAKLNEQELEELAQQGKEQQPIQPEADGSYLLLPGEYWYTAEAEGYVSVDNKAFIVEHIERDGEILPTEIRVTLTVMDEPEEAEPTDAEGTEGQKKSEDEPQQESGEAAQDLEGSTDLDNKEDDGNVEGSASGETGEPSDLPEDDGITEGEMEQGSNETETEENGKKPEEATKEKENEPSDLTEGGDENIKEEKDNGAEESENGEGEVIQDKDKPSSAEEQELDGAKGPVRGAGEQKCGDDLYWEFDESTGTLTITGSGAMTNYSSASNVPWHSLRSQIQEIILPNELTTVGAYAFCDCSDLQSILIPNTVASIGRNAFCECIGLASITIPEGVTSIGTCAFYGCTSLTSAVIADSVETIGYAFAECTNLTSITVPCDVRYSSDSFSGSTSITSIRLTTGTNGVMPTYKANANDSTYCTGSPWYVNREHPVTVVMDEGITTISDYAFYDCTGLTTDIPSTVTSIGRYAFYGCTGFTSITIPTGITTIMPYAFQNCTGLTSLTIPEGVTSIGTCAFYGCTSLTSVVIADSVETIGYAFAECTNLTSITVPCSVIYSSNSFSGSTSITNIRLTIGTGVVPTYKANANDNTYCTGSPWYANKEHPVTVVMDEGITTISDYAFYDCTGLTTDIPSTVTSIGRYAFYGCTGFTSITIPTGITTIMPYAFQNCTGLTSLTIPEGVTSIADYAFSGCTGLTSAVIADSVRSMGMSAFANCVNLTNITVPCSVIYHGIEGSSDYYRTFNGSASITTIRLTMGTNGVMPTYKRNANDITYCPGSPWYENREHPVTVVMDEGITTISNYAFYNCTGVTTEIPSTVTSIGSYAFSGTNGAITIPERNSIMEYGNYAFRCTGVKSAYICKGAIVYAHAFENCTGLNRITVPCDYNLSGNFQGCTGITEIHFTVGHSKGVRGYSDTNTGIGLYTNTPWYQSRNNNISIIFDEGITSIGKYAFFGCTGLKTINVPSSLNEIQQYAFSSTGLQKIQFLGNAPTIASNSFSNVVADAYYFSHKTGWDTAANQNYGGTLFWHTRVSAEALPKKVSSDMIGFFVFDYETKEPLQDATITIDSFSATTDADGFAELTGILEGTQTVSVCCDGYRDKETELRNLKRGSQYVLYMAWSFAKPTITSVLLTLEDAETHARESADILKEKAWLPEDTHDYFSIDVTADYANEIKAYYLIQNGKPIKTSTTGNFFDLEVKDIAPATSIYVMVEGKDGVRSDALRTNFQISDISTVQEEEDGTLTFGKAFKWTIPSDIPCIGGGELSLDILDDLPVKVEWDGDTVKIAVNLISYDASKEEISSVFKGDTWNNIKTAANDKDLNRLDVVMNSIRNGFMSNTAAKKLDINKNKWDVKVWGYLEGSKEYISGKINFTFDFKSTHEYQHIVANVPIVVTWEFEGKLDASATAKLRFGKIQRFSDIEFSGNVHPSISLTIGAGPGIAGLASATINGKGQFDIDANFTEYGDSVRAWLTFGAFFKVKLLLLEFNLSIAEKEFTLYESFDAADNQASLPTDVMDLNNYSLRSRSVAAPDALEWKSEAELETAGVEDAPLLRSGEGAEEGGEGNETPVMRDDPSVLQQSSYSDSCLSIVECGGQRLMFLLMDDQDRPVGDGTKLCYSVFDEDAGWSEPTAVEDDGTADFAPKVFTAGGRAYVVWIDVNGSVAGMSLDDIASIASKMEIKLAEYEPQSSSFTVTRLTNDAYYDTMPQVKVSGSTVYVVWLKNTSNNLLMNDASNSIWSYRSDTGATTMWADGLENVTEINATVKNGALSVAYVTDADGDYMTTDDRTLVSLSEGGTATTLAENKTIAELSSHEGDLLWYEDGALTTTNEGAENGAFCGLDKPIYGSYQVLETTEKTYIVFPGNVYSDDGQTLYIELFAYVYDKASEQWGDAVQLTSLGKTISDYKAYVDGQGKIQLVVTASTLTEDTAQGTIEEATSLHNLTVRPHADLVLAGFTYDDVTFDGTTYTLESTATVCNNGTIDTENPISLTLCDENDTVVATQAVSGGLIAGGAREITGSFVIPTITGANSVFTVKAVMTGDSRDTNNTKEIRVAREKIVVSMDDYAMFNDYYVLSVAVKNEGLFAATPTLECRLDADDGELLFSDTYTLDAGETTHAIIRVNAKNVQFEGAARNLYIKTDGDSINGFFFVLYAPHDHTWGEPEWVWNDNHTEATAAFECTVCMTREIVAATVTKETVEPTEEEDGSITYAATTTGPDERDYTDVVTIIVSKSVAVKIYSATASFEGKIGINFYLWLPDEVIQDTGAYILFSGGEGNKTINIAANYMRNRQEKQGVLCSGFTYDVVANEIRDNINLKVYDGNGNIIRITNKDGTNDYTETGINYSLMTYATRMLDSGSATMKALASAAIDYGTAAQIYFEYHHEGLAVSSAVTSVQLSDLSQYAAAFDGSLPNGVTRRTISALFESDNSFRVYYFYGENIDPNSYTYLIDTRSARLRSNAKGHYIELSNVPSNMLDKPHTFTISDGTTTYTITASVLTYARSSVLNGDEARQNLGKSLYLYNAAAKAHFGDE